MLGSSHTKPSAIFAAVARRIRQLFGLPPRVALYVRHSAGDTTGSSLERQIRQTADYGASIGTVVRVYVDSGSSRASLDKFVSAARLGDFDLLVIRDVDRLTRDFSKFAQLIGRGVRIHSVRDGRFDDAGWAENIASRLFSISWAVKK
jgi:Resolvase, N terminal domain